MTRRAARRSACVVLALAALLAAPSAAWSQRVTLAGRVLGSDGSPIVFAAVTIASADSGQSPAELTDAEGRFRVVMAHRTERYSLTVRMRGFATQVRQIAVGQGDSLVVLPDIRLVREVQGLPGVRTVTRRVPPVREQGRFRPKPGETRAVIDPSSGFANTLTGDVSGDIGLALGAVPGLAAAPGPNGEVVHSLAGLDAQQNRATLNGADLIVAPPREGGVLRVSSRSYDPTVAMSGARADWEMLGGSYGVYRTARLTMDGPFAPLGSPVTRALGHRTAAPMFSGLFSGPLQGAVKFYVASVDAQHRSSSMATLASANATTLDVLGVGAEQARRILAARESLGMTTGRSGAVSQQTSRVALLTRLDFTREAIGSILESPFGVVSASSDQGTGRVFYLLLGARGSRTTGGGVSPRSLPASATSSSDGGLTAQAFHSAFFRGFVVNETRLTLGTEGRWFAPASIVPAASVLAGGAVASAAGIASVNVAGNGGAPMDSRYSTLQLVNETQWTSHAGAHQWKLGLDLLVDRLSADRGASHGRFDFASIEEFAANRPSAFSRTVNAAAFGARGLHLGIGLGDIHQVSRRFSWQYGVRAEGQAIGTDGRNPVVDAQFGVRSGTLPLTWSIAPMAGFTWMYGPTTTSGFARPYPSLVGGIRDYRGSVHTRQAQGVLAEAGLPDGPRQLRCVGEAAPIPAWGAYEGGSGAIPDRCADAQSGARFALDGLPVSSYARNFAPGHSWRADLTWTTQPAPRVTASLGGMLALNTDQPTPVDLNFNGARRFSLDAEGGRPVFVPAESFVGTSGYSSPVESRRIGAYTRANELRSDLRSRSASITAAVSYMPAIRLRSSTKAMPVTLAYTLSDTRAQSNGFASTTSGDPRSVEWGRSSASRHNVLLSSAVQIPDWFRVTAGLNMRSGIRYTPLVLGDVNGDGLVNDRAFVFDAERESDANLRGAMAGLLASAPSAAVNCLRTQRGTIAQSNSCVSPWTATINGAITVDPARFGLQNRGRVQLHVTNVLAAVDRVVHGADGLRGWGQPAVPDAVLLHVRGFDATTRRVQYAVNPSFGDTRVYRNFFQSPFRLTLDVRIDVGPNRERAAMVERLAPTIDSATSRLDSAAVAERLMRQRYRLFDPLVEQARTLELTAAHVDSLNAMSRYYQAARDSVYGELARYFAGRDGNFADREGQRRWREAIASLAWTEWRMGQALRALITPAQWQRYFSDPFNRIGSRPLVMEEGELRRTLATWQTIPR